MLTPASFLIDSIISFKFYPASILGTGITNAKVLAILDANTAGVLGFDAAGMHANVYATLPNTVPNDFTAYSYLKLLLPTGGTTIVGIPWIIDDTLAVASTASYQFTISNVTPSDVNQILQALSAAGFTAVSMRTITQS